MYRIETTIYHCSYCRKHYLGSTGCKAHEKVCYRNPDNKCCWTCKYGGHWATTCTKLELDLSEVERPIRNCRAWEQSKESIIETEGDEMYDN